MVTKKMNNKKYRLQSIFFSAITVVSFIVIYSCHHEIINPGDGSNNGGGNGGGGGNNDSLVCFESDILPLFTSYCAKSGCHDARTKMEGYVFNSYSNIVVKGIIAGNSVDSKVYKVLLPGADNKMPPRGNTSLSANQVALIKKWIDEGAKNTTGCNVCDTALYTFSGAVNPILTASCLGCHSGSGASGGIDLTTYSGVLAVVNNGKLLGSIKHQAGYVAMPQGTSQLSDCNIAQIEKWINSGAPNN